MDRGAWQATVHGTVRVGHDLVTERERNRAVYENKKILTCASKLLVA